MSSSAVSGDSRVENVQHVIPIARPGPLRLLTITPFYPSAQDPTQGGFISEPLQYLEAFGVSNKTIAVQPFYRGRAYSLAGSAAQWSRYFSLPSHIGLPVAAKFLERHLLRSITKEHRREPFDLIHAHAALPCGHAAMLLSERLSIPFVVSVHGLDAFFTRQAGTVVGSWCKHVAKGVYRSAATVICISEKVREQVLSEVKANTTVIYNGVDIKTFTPVSGRNSALTVLTVGNLVPSKGHASLLRAFADALKAAPECRLEIIGDGPEQKNLVRLATKIGIAGKVDFRGRQSRAYVAEAMRRCSVFALPSAYEGLGCVYLEAMACAKPVIGCCGQGIDEVIQNGRTGILVRPGNDLELTNALIVLLRDPALRDRVGSAARDLVVSRFAVQHQAQLLAETYHGCIA